MNGDEPKQFSTLKATPVSTHMELPFETVKSLFPNNTFYFRQDVMRLWLAHLAIYNKFDGSAVILDNNVQISSNFESAIIELQDTPDYDIILLNGGNDSNDSTNTLDLVNTVDNIDVGAYIISRAGAIKLLRFINVHGITSMFGDTINSCMKEQNMIVYRTNLVDSTCLDSFVGEVIPQLEGYTFYSGLDSFGYDTQLYEGKTLLELKEICDSRTEHMGFNTYGFMKYTIKPLADLCYLFSYNTDNSTGLYVKNMNSYVQNKIAEITDIVNEKKRLHKYTSNITFTITTCKRLTLFIQTMERLLMFCKDIDVIDRFLCVDDNSTEQDREIMKTRFPFFDFINKGPSDKGHARSLNMIFNTVQTDYVMHFEDDWMCNKHFNITPLAEHLHDGRAQQIILRNISGGTHNKVIEVDGNTIYKYTYNPYHSCKPFINKRYDMITTYHRKYIHQTSPDQHWWWPNFSLNPSVFNIKTIKSRVGYFNEHINQELFEYDFSLRCYSVDIVVLFTDMVIEHTGQVSSYSLNDMRRSYDQ
jgi:hypothetical protein